MHLSALKPVRRGDCHAVIRRLNDAITQTGRGGPTSAKWRGIREEIFGEREFTGPGARPGG